MWFLYAIASFLLWGAADLFYKKGNMDSDEDSHYKTGIAVGIIMGLHATLYLIIKQPTVNFIDLIKYFPVSFCYIASMIISYKGLKYLELSIASPIENGGGVITALLVILFFHEKLLELEWFGILLIGLGVLCLSQLEKKKVNLKKVSILLIIFPLLYALLDGIGTFLDSVYLDKLELVSEDSALICYEYTFLIYAVILLLIFKFKKRQKITIKNEKDKIVAAILETAGQFFYVFAMASHSVITAPIVGSYSIVSILLSRIFLKEKLSRHKYVAIIIIILGIIFLGIAEGLAE